MISRIFFEKVLGQEALQRCLLHETRLDRDIAEVEVIQTVF